MKTKIISLNVALITYTEAINEVIEFAKNRVSSYCCFANVHMTIEAHRNPEISDAVNNANFVFSDGRPLTVAIKWLKGIKQDRIAGMDFMPDLLEYGGHESLSVFLYGGSEAELKIIKSKIENEYPKVRVAGFISPPFRLLTEHEENTSIEIINNSNANIVFVSLGCPKQELWMARNSSKIRAVLLGVGGAFPVYAGLTKRAPIWMQQYSLEWMYRLIQEPQRMWKRYLVTNSLFIFLLFKDLIFTKIGIRQSNL